MILLLCLTYITQYDTLGPCMLLRAEFSRNPPWNSAEDRGREAGGGSCEASGRQALGQSEVVEEDACSCRHCWKKLGDSFNVEIRAVWFCCLDEQWVEARSHPTATQGDGGSVWVLTVLLGRGQVREEVTVCPSRGGASGVDQKLQGSTG